MNQQQVVGGGVAPPPLPMIFGAIVGDIAGSTYEWKNCKSEMACEIFAPGSRFTDDTVLTLATAMRFLLPSPPAASSTPAPEYIAVYQDLGRAYPRAGYGESFFRWLGQVRNPQPYNSFGNGSAMRVSPIGWVAPSLLWALDEAERSAAVTHNHPSAIKGAQAVAAAIYLARQGHTKGEIRTYISATFDYNLDRTLAQIRPTYEFDVSCDGSVPEAIIAFLESTDFESAVRKAISLGGDSDTIACIAGSIAQAFYGTIPQEMEDYCLQVLDPRLLAINDEFWKRYQQGTLLQSTDAMFE